MTALRISQLADRVGVKPTTLRFYEQAGLLPARRSESGYRLYDDTAVERIEFIQSGKRLGLPLEEIRDLMAVWENGLCADVRARLRPLVLAGIDEAQRRTAELDAFSERLRRALSDLDDPAPEGRCGPGCGYLHEPAPPIACSLDGEEQSSRIARWKEVLSDADRSHVDGGVVLRLPASRSAALAELAAAEQACCPFFEFTLVLARGVVELRVRAPEHAAPLLTEIFG
ncbi:MerR family transcriptional regulator [Allokutzneria multivorans]|uniref:MerR family transcriptional regulator n=1 Tax=Allokutzneria multivorans TaxID=1142134 RepID=A0ABP7SHH9_9PSEU